MKIYPHFIHEFDGKKFYKEKKHRFKNYKINCDISPQKHFEKLDNISVSFKEKIDDSMKFN